MQDAKVFRLQEWERNLLDNTPRDLQECVTGVNHPDFNDLLQHSYLDKKTWTREQIFTFSESVKGSFKDTDGRYVIPLIFNSKIKKSF